jgi:hypothetical protein
MMSLMLRGIGGCVLALLFAMPAAPARLVESESFTVPLPDGYSDITELIRSRGFPRRQVSLQANAVTRGYQPTIAFQLAPIWGGTLGDLAVCRQSAESFAGPKGKVKTARMIDGPAPSGKVCQIHLVRPEGIALITELISSAETWLMTCNHAPGDAAAEKVCRATLATFKFKPAPPVLPKIVLPRVGVRECDDYLDKYVACLSRRLQDDEIAPYRAMLKLTADLWVKAAASEGGRKELPATCTKTLAQTKSLMAPSIGCEW